MDNKLAEAKVKRKGLLDKAHRLGLKAEASTGPKKDRLNKRAADAVNKYERINKIVRVSPTEPAEKMAMEKFREENYETTTPIYLDQLEYEKAPPIKKERPMPIMPTPKKIANRIKQPSKATSIQKPKM